LNDLVELFRKQLDYTKTMESAVCKHKRLKIATDINIEKMDLFDMTLEINTSKFYPFRKPGIKSLYVYAE